MFTSRAEYRLLLREDNADRRLSPIGERLGLLDVSVGARVREKTAAVKEELERMSAALVRAGDEVNRQLADHGSAPITRSTQACELLKRPELDYPMVLALAGLEPMLTQDQAAELETDLKYEGYVRRQAEAVERFRRLEDTRIPEWIDYRRVSGLSTEARERLSSIRPGSLGQAARMPGITPAAISLLAVHLKAAREGTSRPSQ
jgi:tRNA uridine 5-carboxymethylaminomethyl modification enzyme